MKYEFNWHIPGRVLFVEYRNNLSIEDIQSISVELESYLESGESPVHLICDVNAVDSVPGNINKLRNELDILQRPEWGWVIMIGSNQVVGFLVSLVSQVLGLSVRTADSIEEGMKIIKRVDNSIA
jgi:hypothetical protein